MSSIDTLKAYEELMAAGYDSAKARASVYMVASSLDHLATKDDVNNAINNLKVELRASFKITWILGSPIFAAACLPALQEIFSQ